MSTLDRNAKRALRERINRMIGKELNFKDGIGTVVGKSENSVAVNVKVSDKYIVVLLSDIVTKGSKYYVEKDTTEFEEAVKTEADLQPEVVVTNSVKTTITEDKTDSVKDAETITEDGDNDPISITCQFCGHPFMSNDYGMLKPDDPSDACIQCMDLAEKRLLASGIKGEDITTQLITDFLSRFYSLVENVPIFISKASSSHDVNCECACTETEEETVNNKETGCCCSEVEHTDSSDNLRMDYVNPVELYLSFRNNIARMLVESIHALGGEVFGVETLEDNQAVVIKLGEYNFNLTELCGGYIVNIVEDKEVIEDEFVSLDSFLERFIISDEDEDSSEDEEDEEDDEIMFNHLPLGSFHRLQNCKNENNNKKLVKIIEVIIPEDKDSDVGLKSDITYRVEDKTGKTYKVSENKLKPSVKSF